MKFFVTLFSGPMRSTKLSPQNRNLVHTWTMGGCIMYTRIRLLLLICLLIFLSPQFSVTNVSFYSSFVTFFSGTVKLTKLKFDTQMNNGRTYHLYQNQATATYLSLYFFIFLSPIFSYKFVFLLR